MNFKLLLSLPIIEIVLFILFGDIFGFLNVIIWIIFSGIFGFWLLVPKVDNIQISKDIHKPLDWICKRVSGLLLIIPGFATDFIGILLLVKIFRSFIWNILPNSFRNFANNHNFNKSAQTNKNDNIIDVDYKNLAD